MAIYLDFMFYSFCISKVFFSTDVFVHVNCSQEVQRENVIFKNQFILFPPTNCLLFIVYGVLSCVNKNIFTSVSIHFCDAERKQLLYI